MLTKSISRALVRLIVNELRQHAEDTEHLRNQICDVLILQLHRQTIRFDKCFAISVVPSEESCRKSRNFSRSSRIFSIVSAMPEVCKMRASVACVAISIGVGSSVSTSDGFVKWTNLSPSSLAGTRSNSPSGKSGYVLILYTSSLA
jgi:hypothetical protein